MEHTAGNRLHNGLELYSGSSETCRYLLETQPCSTIEARSDFQRPPVNRVSFSSALLISALLEIAAYETKKIAVNNSNTTLLVRMNIGKQSPIERYIAPGDRQQWWRPPDSSGLHVSIFADELSPLRRTLYEGDFCLWREHLIVDESLQTRCAKDSLLTVITRSHTM